MSQNLPKIACFYWVKMTNEYHSQGLTLYFSILESIIKGQFQGQIQGQMSYCFKVTGLYGSCQLQKQRYVEWP